MKDLDSILRIHSSFFERIVEIIPSQLYKHTINESKMLTDDINKENSTSDFNSKYFKVIVIDPII